MISIQDFFGRKLQARLESHGVDYQAAASAAVHAESNELFSEKVKSSETAVQPTINYIHILFSDWSHHQYSEQAKQTKTYQKEKNKTPTKCYSFHKQYHTFRAG